MVKLLSFDIECVFPEEPNLEDGKDLWDYWPFDISCAALKHEKMVDALTFTYSYNPKYGEDIYKPHWDLEDAKSFVDTLWSFYKGGWLITTMNGTGFDFRVLYQITGDERCKEMAWEGFDPTFQMMAEYGFPVGLNSAAIAVGAQPKEEDGAEASLLWKMGQYDRVLRYVKGDVIRTEKIAQSILKIGGLTWRTKNGTMTYRKFLNGPRRVRQLADTALPDTSWMKDEPGKKRLTREDFIGWLQ